MIVNETRGVKGRRWAARLHTTVCLDYKARPIRLFSADVPVSDDVLRVVLADDHPFFREGLRGVLEGHGMVVVGEAEDGAQAARLARELAPDVVVLDLSMPGVSGNEAVGRMVADNPAIRIVILTVSTDHGDVIETLAAGACGYLLKDVGFDDLAIGIRQAAGGNAALSREVMRALVAQARSDSLPGGGPSTDGIALTAREIEVLRLIADGADNAAIGRQLSISRHTVKQYVTNIFEKLGVHSRVEAAVYAVRAGLL